MLDFEQAAWDEGFQQVAGIDEAGRGPLAGPVVAAAVVIERDFADDLLRGALKGLTDSKQLPEHRREYFFSTIAGLDEIQVGTALSDIRKINRLNILKATYDAMLRAVDDLMSPPDFILVDGNSCPRFPCHSKTIVKGDRKSLSIAAASVMAKVTRDRIMTELDKVHPEYGFAKHKGYGTPEHLDAIRNYGPCPIHRTFFEPIKSHFQSQLDLGDLSNEDN